MRKAHPSLKNELENVVFRYYAPGASAGGTVWWNMDSGSGRLCQAGEHESRTNRRLCHGSSSAVLRRRTLLREGDANRSCGGLLMAYLRPSSTGALLREGDANRSCGGLLMAYPRPSSTRALLQEGDANRSCGGFPMTHLHPSSARTRLREALPTALPEAFPWLISARHPGGDFLRRGKVGCSAGYRRPGRGGPGREERPGGGREPAMTPDEERFRKAGRSPAIWDRPTVPAPAPD